MSWYKRAGNVFRPDRLDHELDAELKFHVAERTDDLVAAGMSEADARREALRLFGNYTAQKETTRDMNISRALESVIADLRYGARQLRSAPGFAGVAVLSLALGIGANTAIFQIINAIRLRGLTVPDAHELAAIDKVGEFYSAGWYAGRNTAFTYPLLESIRKNQSAFADLLGFGTIRFNLSRGGESRFADGLFVTANFFDVLGVKPMLGRTFTTEHAGRDCKEPAAVISYAFWQRELGGDMNAIGRTLSLDGRTVPVIGVMNKEFAGLEPERRFDIAVPLCFDTYMATEPERIRMDRRDAWWLTIAGRLKSGWTAERASSHLRDLSPSIFRETLPEVYRQEAAKRYLGNKLRVVSASAGVSSMRREYEDPLWILLATTALVLLIACANLANLLLARASVREREIAVRQALGASRPRLIAQLLAESLLLAGFGALLGALLAQLLGRGLVTFLDNGSGVIHIGLGLDWNVFAFTALLAMVTCVLFGLAPAIRATRVAPANRMRGGRGTAATAERNTLRRALVVSQIALSLVLLVGALLFGRSLRNLITTDTGMESDSVLVASIDTTLPNFTSERRRKVFDELEARIASQPGVASVGRVWLSPFGGSGWNRDVTMDGTENSGKKLVWMNRVGPGYFKTMSTTLLAGRDFDERDDLKAPQVAIVNEEFAKVLTNGKNPIGRTFRVEAEAGKPDEVYQVVGLVKNTKYSGLRENFRAIAFFPLHQDAKIPEGISFMVRTHGPVAGVMESVRRQMSEVNSQLLVRFRMLDVEIERSLLRERLMANLSGAFGVLAGLLSALGLYGVMSYMVARRRSEIGVRIAMGASWRDIMSLIFQEAGRLVIAGLVIGVACAFAVTRYAESLLFGLKANDALTLASACLLLIVTAVAATLIPAGRAVRLDPAVALREE